MLYGRSEGGDYVQVAAVDRHLTELRIVPAIIGGDDQLYVLGRLGSKGKLLEARHLGECVGHSGLYRLEIPLFHARSGYEELKVLCPIGIRIRGLRIYGDPVYIPCPPLAQREYYFMGELGI